MARLGIEPRTPRFSEARKDVWKEADLEDVYL
jgi:hypothetical protein